jgi:hypothetical protein
MKISTRYRNIDMAIDTLRPPTDAQRKAKAAAAIKRSGYNSGGRLKQEESDPAAKDTRMAKRRGGEVGGDQPRGRPDKKSRGKAAVNINIVSPEAAQAEKQQAAAAGLQAGAKLGAAKAVQAMGGGGGKGPPPPPPARGGPMSPPGGAGGPPMGGAPPGAAMSTDEPPMRRGGRAR